METASQLIDDAVVLARRDDGLLVISIDGGRTIFLTDGRRVPAPARDWRIERDADPYDALNDAVVSAIESHVADRAAAEKAKAAAAEERLVRLVEEIRAARADLLRGPNRTRIVRIGERDFGLDSDLRFGMICRRNGGYRSFVFCNASDEEFAKLAIGELRLKYKTRSRYFFIDK